MSEFKLVTKPPNSLDLNLIKHLWDLLDKQVRPMEAPPCDLQQLKDLLLLTSSANLQRSGRVDASAGQSCSGGTSGTYAIGQEFLILWLISVHHIYTHTQNLHSGITTSHLLLCMFKEHVLPPFSLRCRAA